MASRHGQPALTLTATLSVIGVAALAAAAISACGVESRPLESLTVPLEERGACERLTDSDGDGVVDTVTRYLYDDYGRQIAEEYLDDKGGVIERLSNVYDLSGHLASQEIDRAADGHVDERWRFLYGTEGQLVLAEVSSSEGPVFGTRIYGYDNEGRLQRTQLDAGPGGVDQLVEYTYDETGQRAAEHRDRNIDGVIDEIVLLTYDETGLLVSAAHDSDADGQAELVYEYDYDEHGHMLSRSLDEGLDGELDALQLNAYDELGRLVSQTWDDGANGMTDSRTDYDYSCW